MPPVHVAIEAGVVTLLVDCLAFGSSEEQLFEAAWCLTNIASGDLEQTRAVEPALPLLILHLGEKSAVHVVEQCAWAIGNVAGDGEIFRDVLLKQGALHSLSRHLLSPVPSLSRTAAWALSNLIKVGFLGIFPQMCLLK
jgi:importin subunit alpha-1